MARVLRFYSNWLRVNVLHTHSRTLISALPQQKTQFLSKSTLLEVNFFHQVIHKSEFVITSFIVHECKYLSGWSNGVEKSFLSEISSWKSIFWCFSRLWTSGRWVLDEYVVYTYAVLGMRHLLIPALGNSFGAGIPFNVHSLKEEEVSSNCTCTVGS